MPCKHVCIGNFRRNFATQFACFTSTKVQILTQKALLGVRNECLHIGCLRETCTPVAPAVGAVGAGGESVNSGGGSCGQTVTGRSGQRAEDLCNICWVEELRQVLVRYCIM